MLVLVVDSSTPAVTAALAEVASEPQRPGARSALRAQRPESRVALRAQRCTVDARAHGELLGPQIQAVLEEVGARARDLDAIVAGLGPGPFTGLRVGLVTAASMGDALGIPTYGVCSLDAIGRAAAASGEAAIGRAERLLVAADARRREVYWAAYAGGVRLAEPGVDTPAVVAERARELGLTAAVGDGALRYADALGLPVRDEPRYPPAGALAELAADRVLSGALGERLTPLYLRRPDAVEPGARKPVLAP